MSTQICKIQSNWSKNLLLSVYSSVSLHSNQSEFSVEKMFSNQSVFTALTFLWDCLYNYKTIPKWQSSNQSEFSTEKMFSNKSVFTALSFSDIFWTIVKLFQTHNLLTNHDLLQKNIFNHSLFIWLSLLWDPL